MRKRALGKTGIDVSELGLGTWGLSGDAYGAVAESEVAATLERAIELGITLFETADVYGKGVMERELGRRVPADALIVTKVGTDRDAMPPRKRFDVSFLRASIERSTERLGRSDFAVLLHNPGPTTAASDEPFEFMKELKKRKLVKAWGVSAGDADVARAALGHGAEIVEMAYNVFVSADVHGVAGDLVEAGAALLARSVLAHGLLAGQWSAEREFHAGDHRAQRWNGADMRQRIQQLDALRPLVSGSVHSLRAVALRFVLANDLVSSAVLGPRGLAQLAQLAREAGDGPPYLSDMALAELAARLRSLGVP